MNRTFKRMTFPTTSKSKKVDVRESEFINGVASITISGDGRSIGATLSRSDTRLMRDLLNNILEVSNKQDSVSHK